MQQDHTLLKGAVGCWTCLRASKRRDWMISLNNIFCLWQRIRGHPLWLLLKISQMVNRTWWGCIMLSTWGPCIPCIISYTRWGPTTRTSRLLDWAGGVIAVSDPDGVLFMILRWEDLSEDEFLDKQHCVRPLVQPSCLGASRFCTIWCNPMLVEKDCTVCTLMNAC